MSMRFPFMALSLILIAVALAPSRSDASSVQFRAAESASVASGVSAPSTSIAYIDSSSVGSEQNGTSVTLTLPAHIAGDLLICTVEARHNGTINTPSSWTQIYTLSQNNGYRAAAFYRVATSSGAGNLTINKSGSNTGMVARCASYRGVNTSNPFDIGYAQQYSSSGSNVISGSVTPVTSGTMLLFAAHADAQTNPNTFSGWTQAYFERPSGTNVSVGLYHRPWDTTTTGSFTLGTTNGNRSHGVLMALRPLTPTPPTPPSLTIDKPVDTIVGDVMVASVAVTADSSAAVAGISIVPPAGWTLIRQVHQNAGNGNNGNRHSRLATYVRAATAGEPVSYTWSFTGSAHTGAVGGIATFSGVYIDPDSALASINVHDGTPTNSGRDHTAPGLTISVDRGMLLTVHEFANSRTWATHTGMDDATEAVDIASQAAGSAGISMGMFYEPRPSVGATGTRTARASSNSSTDRGATQSIGLKPIPLICTAGDNFNRANGSPGANWIVSNSGGSFGNPLIANNRLRLTDATGNVATMATLQRLFPGAGNRIELEFQHFAYGGNGADGIVVVLSDSALPTTPGGYGGSLGYAQNTSAEPSKPGFGGGWLGVGIDEYGNFSNATEGRQGGPGERADSVAIRGSGSGITGYRYHTGTAANLNPQVDNNGSANPVHQYRIIVDHSNSTNAWVSVERKTGANYVTLVAPYDAKTQTSQAAVPEKWVLSWTGATGGSTNIHEIDNLQVCATYMETTTAADHYAIQHGISGVNCQPETVTITAKNSANATISASGATIAVTARRTAGSPTANRGDWILVTGGGTLNNGAADDGLATYTFAPDEQQVVLELKNTHQQTVNIDVTDNLGVSESSGAGNSEPGYNQNLAFTASGFRMTNGANPPSPLSIATQTAGVTSATYALQAIRTDNNTGACVGAFANNTDLNIDLGFQCNNPTTCQSGQLVRIANNGTTNTIAANPNSGVASYTTRTLRFGANSQAPFTLVYPDVGQLTLYARYNIPLANGNPSGNFMLGSSNAFVVKPYDFELSDIVRTAGGTANPEAIDAGGAVFARAGEAFSATVKAVNAQGNATPNYGRESTPESVKLTSALVSGLGLTVNPALANPSAFGSFTGGAATGTTFSWNEVGIIRLTPEVADENYLGAGNVVGTPSANVGRFIPDRFALASGTLKNRSSASCAPDSTFTYMDEPLLLEYSLNAQNTSGGTTQNYAGAFAKLNLTSTAAHGFGARDVPSSTDLSSRFDTVSLAGSWSSGTADVDAVVAIARNAAPDGPYNSLRIGVAPVDGDGVRLATAGLNLDVDGNAANDHAQIGAATSVRFGRLRLLNALGSERVALPVRMQVEYWNGTAFVANSSDSCTKLPRSTIAMANYQGLAPCNTAFADTSIDFVGGKATPVLTAPTPAHGSVDLRVNLSAESGQYCPAANATQSDVTSAARSYLKGRWNDAANGAGYDDDAIARATFGIYGAQAPKRFIYSRENY